MHFIRHNSIVTLFNNHVNCKLVFSDERFLNLMSLQTTYVLKICNCTVALYKAEGIINNPFLLLYFRECGASVKVITKDVNEQNSCQEVAFFTILT